MAYRKQAYQSSTFVNRDGSLAAAYKAVNNLYGYNEARTLQNKTNWWRVDLGRAVDISLIELYNYPGYCETDFCSKLRILKLCHSIFLEIEIV